jgi:hypothetical protein
MARTSVSMSEPQGLNIKCDERNQPIGGYYGT